MPLAPTLAPEPPAARLPRPALRDGGRFMLSDGLEHRCQTAAITATGVVLRAPALGRVGEHVICYLDQYGRVEGRIVQLHEDGFAIAFSGPALKREKLAQQLALAATRPGGDPAAPRQHDRLEPTRRRVVLRVADGRHILAQIINLSRSGVALTCPVPLAVGDAVLVGKRPARVARITQRLIGLSFEREIAPEDFTADIIL